MTDLGAEKFVTLTAIRREYGLEYTLITTVEGWFTRREMRERVILRIKPGNPP